MPIAEFSEDEFETNLVVELRDQYGPGLPHFKPSRRLERHVGFDFSLHTYYGPFAYRHGLFNDDPVLLSLLPQQRKAVLPHRHVNAFIQCKRPYRLIRSNDATKRQALNHFNGGPCFYFKVDSSPQGQNSKLVAVQNKVQPHGLVRYASPCFWTFNEADAAFSAGLLVQRTHFASPASMLGHSIYAYMTPTRRGQGFSVPEAHDPSAFIFEVRKLTQMQESRSFASHLVMTWRQLSQGETPLVTVTENDWRAAELALGDAHALALDPLQLIDFDTKTALIELEAERGMGRQSARDHLIDIVEPSLLPYAALLMSLQRFFRRELRTEWLVFTDEPLHTA